MDSRNRNASRVEEVIENGEFNETIEKSLEREGQGCKHNVMTRFFCGPESFCKNGGQEALDRAKENTLKHYAVVGLLEHFQLTFKICQKRFPYFLPVFPRDPASLKVNQGMKSNTRKERKREMRFFAASPLSFAAPPLMREIGKREPARSLTNP